MTFKHSSILLDLLSSLPGLSLSVSSLSSSSSFLPLLEHVILPQPQHKMAKQLHSSVFNEFCVSDVTYSLSCIKFNSTCLLLSSLLFFLSFFSCLVSFHGYQWLSQQRLHPSLFNGHLMIISLLHTRGKHLYKERQDHSR